LITLKTDNQVLTKIKAVKHYNKEELIFRIKPPSKIEVSSFKPIISPD